MFCLFGTEAFTLKKTLRYSLKMDATISSSFKKSVRRQVDRNRSWAFNGSFPYQKGKHYSSVSYKEAEYKGRRIIIFRDDYEHLTGITDYKVNITKNLRSTPKKN